MLVQLVVLKPMYHSDDVFRRRSLLSCEAPDIGAGMDRDVMALRIAVLAAHIVADVYVGAARRRI